MDEEELDLFVVENGVFIRVKIGIPKHFPNATIIYAICYNNVIKLIITGKIYYLTLSS